jgi:metal-responsive CopG/Arc/MetJ family transcriptional regulator
MPESKPVRVIVPMTPALIEQIDDYRYRERIPSRSEAIRTLIRRGLPKA